MRLKALAAVAALLLMTRQALAFDYSHQQFAGVLSSHVQWQEDGGNSVVDYAALQAAPEELERYLEQLSAVEAAEFKRWPTNEQLAFLINAYNAFTLKLIVDHYPVDSIRDIGRFWQSPWKLRFFTLLGEQMHLDQVEHEIIREPGRYDEPRIHFAVNCASIGCPALRPEPFTAEDLEAQLEDSSKRFLSDASRNRYRDGRLEVSSIFKWYREDFERGWRGAETLGAFLALYTDALGLDAETREQLAGGAVQIRFLNYDWNLNRLKAQP
ncbi:DUF547 domain-containing protein [Haliea sp. E1-2-M8]|uniref:DUF547 domain-containing protein n=1 Tax=Haliea sp. E1-2-M8 TaxID=3064706 RepID=UPI0027286E90|nr:DUF547 domain-containing protein [Haliea sp. E1-2-M8]MDO8860899.1 DUF547 domain-containing protein [Haliea sp. E1-2-M8]